MPKRFAAFKSGYINRYGPIVIRENDDSPSFHEGGGLGFQNGLAIVVDIDGAGGGVAAPGISISHVFWQVGLHKSKRSIHLAVIRLRVSQSALLSRAKW